MWKTLSTGQRIVLRLRNTISRRTFLSNAYKCEEAWNKRLDSALLQNVKPREMFFELSQKFQNAGKVSAVDIDIFANAINDDSLVNELIDLLHKLRLTVETSNTLESTHHAVIRYCLEHNQTELLLEVLNDRLNYGIFPDHFCLNILMDSFIKQQDFASAAKVATLLMLQEDSEHPISNALAVYSCHKYLEDPDKWIAPEPPKDESTEVIKVRVAYIRNPYFDDHFDLVEPSDLVGKTLVFFGKIMNDTLGRTCQLRGLILYKKYTAATDLIKEWLQAGIEKVVYSDVLQLIKDDISKIPEDKITDDIKALITELSKLENSDLMKEDLTEAIENKVKLAISQQAEQDISQQHQVYLDWEKNRMLRLQAHFNELDRENRLANIAKMKKDLEEKEQILTFFEREEQIELQIEERNKRDVAKYRPGEELEDIKWRKLPAFAQEQRLTKE